MEYNGIMFERLNDTYLKAKGKKYIAEELKKANFEESCCQDSVFYVSITPFEKSDDRKSIEIGIYLNEEKLNLALLVKYEEIHIDVKNPEDCFINPKYLGVEKLKLLHFIDECVLKLCKNVYFSDVEKAEKILNEYSENY